MSDNPFLIFVQVIVSGLAIGSIYALVALGFVLIYKATDAFNFAHGELMMLGAYICYSLITFTGMGYLLSFILTMCLCFGLGMLIELLFIRPLLGKPVFSVIMVTIGLAIIMQGLVSLVWGDDVHNFPQFLNDQVIRFCEVPLRPVELAIFATTIVLVILFLLFFKYSKVGIAMRATANNQDTAKLMGISVGRIFSVSWAIAAVIAAVGGISYANVLFVSPDMSHIGLRACPAAILGGLDSIPGAIVGGIIIGVCETLAGAYLDQMAGGGIKEITSFVILIGILMIKPYGLYGKKEIIKV